MKIRVGGIFVAAFALAWACSDSFLDQQPQGVLDQNALSNAFGANASLISAYSMLDGYNIDNANTWAADPVNWILGSITSDDAYKGSEATDDPGGGIIQVESYVWTPTMNTMNDKYVPSYEGIRRSNNTIILATAATDLSDADRTRIIGEAKFLRAWFHFELYKVFTHVPYFREDDTDLKKTNEGVDVLAECVLDAKDAVAALPEKQSDVGRPTKFAAMALLGKLYMYQAQPASGSTLDPAKLALAKEQFDLVLPQYKLVDCYHDLWESASENNTESIFAVQSNAFDNNQARNANWLDQLANPQGGITSCCGFHQPSQNLVNAYRVKPDGTPLNNNSSNSNPTAAEPVDPRLDFNVGRNGVPYYDWGVHTTSWIRSPSYGGPYSNKKYKPFASDPRVSGGWNGASNNVINIQLIRLADVMLMLAECEVEIGSLSRAEQLVNDIRKRAANCSQGPDGAEGDASITTNITDANVAKFANYNVQPYPTGTFSSKDIARDAVRLERRLELALEGHRFFDLKRWGYDYASTTINNYLAVEKTRRSYLDGYVFTEKNMSFPLPTSQIQLSITGGVPSLKQNPGY